MKTQRWKFAGPILSLVGVITVCSLRSATISQAAQPGEPSGIRAAEASGPEGNTSRMIEEGRETFRFDTFGDEAYWGDALKLHQAISGAKLGGVGPGLSPKAALDLGLKVDMDALPPDLVQQVKEKKVDFDDPATTVALLKLNAVLGVKGFFNKEDKVQSVGITCALCHSTVDNAFAPGIGHRLDGWPNRDLNVGKIITLAPNLKPLTDRLGIDETALKKALIAWGPGKYDAEVLHDAKPFARTARRLPHCSHQPSG